MRITTVIGSLGCGGAERNLIKLSAALAAQGHELTLLTLVRTVGDSDFFVVPASVVRQQASPEAASDCRWFDVLGQRRRRRTLRQALLATAPDVVISFIDTNNVQVLSSLRGTSVPVVVCERINMHHHRIGWRWRMLRNLTYPRAAAVVVQTSAARRQCRQRHPAWRLQQIPNWIEPPPSGCRWPLPKQQALARLQQGFTVLAVGRLHPQKGHDLLIRAMAQLAETYSQLHLVILGEGPARADLQRLIDAHGLQKRVVLAGAVKDPQRWMASCDLFVLPSRFEGFPTALAEAMAVGCPVISCDCPDGPAEMIRHQQDGWLIPVDDLSALVEAMQALIEDPERRQRLSSAARQISARYSEASVVAQWQQLLAAVAR